MKGFSKYKQEIALLNEKELNKNKSYNPIKKQYREYINEVIKNKLKEHPELRNNFTKFYDYFKHSKYSVSHKTLKEEFENNRVGKYVRKLNKSLMGTKFSYFPNAYQMDIYFLNRQNMYLLAININTRFAWIKKIKNKSTNEVLPAIQKFVEEQNPKYIETDKDKCFSDYRTVDYLKNHGVRQKVIIQSLHTDLAIINRFCKSLNNWLSDMSSEEKAENIIKLVKRYNKTHHKSIGMRPVDMEGDKLLEEYYIFSKLDELDDKKKLMLNDEIKKGDKVRYILANEDKKKTFQKAKNKNELSKYYYIVEEVISPWRYTIIAADGTVKQLPRYRLYKVEKKGNLKYAPSMEDKSNEVIYKDIVDVIIKYKKPYYRINQIMRDEDGNKVKNVVEISVKDIRVENPTGISAVEKRFLEKHKDWYYNDDIGMILRRE